MHPPRTATRIAWIVSAAVAWAAPAPAAAQQGAALGADGMFTRDGLVVQRVDPGSPADAAGIAEGDLILTVDDVVPRNARQLAAVLDSSGGTVAVVLRRGLGGRTRRVTVELGGAGVLPAPYLFGATGGFGRQGFQVQKVYEGSPAQDAGLRPGDVVVRFNGRAVTDQQALQTALATSAGRGVLTVGRNGQLGQLRVRMPVYKFGTLGEHLAQGSQIEVVSANTPAEAAGLRPGDVVVSLNNQQIRSQSDWDRAVDTSGGQVEALVRRGAQLGKVRVEVMNNALGAWCEPVRGGLEVTSAYQGGFARELGLRPGDVILRVDGRPVQSLAGLEAALENVRRRITVTIRSAATGQVGDLSARLD